MHKLEACNYKKLYDTEFEASRAAVLMERLVQEEFTYYPCGRHWHIAHKDRKQRNKHVKDTRTHCDICNVNFKMGRYGKHVKTIGHQTKEREQLHVES